MKKLVIFSQDWADEFTCEQFKVMDEEKYAEWVIRKDNPKYDTFAFGTNEYFEQDELHDDSFKVVDITDTQAHFLESTLGKTFGTGIIGCFS